VSHDRIDTCVDEYRRIDVTLTFGDTALSLELEDRHPREDDGYTPQGDPCEHEPPDVTAAPDYPEYDLHHDQGASRCRGPVFLPLPITHGNASGAFRLKPTVRMPMLGNA
jgi:hypothetical protein